MSRLGEGVGGGKGGWGGGGGWGLWNWGEWYVGYVIGVFNCCAWCTVPKHMHILVSLFNDAMGEAEHDDMFNKDDFITVANAAGYITEIVARRTRLLP